MTTIQLIKLLVTVSALLSQGEATPGSYLSYPTSFGAYFKAVPKYNFDYAIDDGYHGSNFGASESRKGDVTRGSYFVDLPDGRRQKVSYYVDGEKGYQADVSYEPNYKPKYGKVGYQTVYVPAPIKHRVSYSRPVSYIPKVTYTKSKHFIPVTKTYTHTAKAFIPKSYHSEIEHHSDEDHSEEEKDDSHEDSHHSEEAHGIRKAYTTHHFVPRPAKSYQRVNVYKPAYKKITYQPRYVKSYKPVYEVNYQPVYHSRHTTSHPHFTAAKHTYG